MDDTPLLAVNNLSLSFITEGKPNQVLQDVSFALQPNEILGIVGESGSGKSVSALSILGLLPKKKSRIDTGTIRFNGSAIEHLEEAAYRTLRGREIAMIFQEPMSSLNPSMRCGKQVRELLLTHTGLSKAEAKAETLSLFEKVKLPNPKRMYMAYPHELSGGQKQRVMIAMAISCKPKVLIADEPTTALDVTVQKEILSLLMALQQETGMSMLFISHDLALVSEIASNVLVMYQGKVIEYGATAIIFSNPKETYTKALINSRPGLEVRLKRLPTVADYIKGNKPSPVITAGDRKKHHEHLYDQPPLLEVKNVSKTYFTNPNWFGATAFRAVDDVTFNLYEGETLGLVGESGCGKSTLGNAILQLDKATAGTILYKGVDITSLKRQELRKLRREIQLIFQDPYASLNPRLSIGNAIMEPMVAHQLYPTKAACKANTIVLLEQVGLQATHFNRYPHEFSGGQRQRIGIARTIALQPKIIVCDESVSALDISVQAQVLNLLNTLKENFGFSYIFISHDLAVVKYMADQLLVMNQGKIVEQGDADLIYSHPKEEYTKNLIHAIPKGKETSSRNF